LGPEHTPWFEIPYEIEHAVQGSSNTKNTIYGVCFVGFRADMYYSPCRLVDTEEHVVPSESEGLLVYPNPASSGWTVQSPEVPARAELYDCIGHRMRSFDIPSSEPHYLDAGGLPPGIYLLRLTDMTGNLPLGTRKLVLLRK
jgi:hypothetical protein